MKDIYIVFYKNLIKINICVLCVDLKETKMKIVYNLIKFEIEKTI